jgi:hypothetical protein
VKKPLKNKGFVNMGRDTVLPADDIIGIFDLDSITVQKDSRNFINAAQAKGEIEDLTSDLPVTFVLCDGKQTKQRVLLSSFSLPTLAMHITRPFPL